MSNIFVLGLQYFNFEYNIFLLYDSYNNMLNSKPTLTIHFLEVRFDISVTVPDRNEHDHNNIIYLPFHCCIYTVDH